MKISFVVPSISSTVLGVVTNHARILSKDYDVQIVGPDLGGGVCSLYQDVWPYTVIDAPHLYRFPEFFTDVRRISDAVEGDVVIAVKSFAQTILPVLRQQRKYGKKIMVYLDEWDGALYQRLTPVAKCKTWLRHVHHPTGEQYVPFMERLFARFDKVLCSTRWLSGQFNGNVVHFGVDTDQFNPEAVDAIDDDCWNGLGLSGKKVLVFGGVVRPHKGVEDILDAMAELHLEDIRLLIAGPENEHVMALKNHSTCGHFVACSGSIRKNEMPRWLTRADAVVLPLQDDLLGRSQMPCKVFEAMAMAKTIIASNTADLPDVLDGCGLIYNTKHELQGRLLEVLNNHQTAHELGAKARQKCIDRYSSESVHQQYRGIIGAFGE